MALSSEAAAAAGGSAMAADAAGSDEARRKRAAARRATMAFGQIVALMARSDVHKRVPIGELTWLVGPAVRAGQFILAGKRTRTGGMVLPVTALLWAQVSDDLDRQLTDATNPMRLGAKDWTSGGNIWLIEAIGDQKTVPQMIAQLTQTAWKEKVVKVRSRDAASGNIAVRSIGPM